MRDYPVFHGLCDDFRVHGRGEQSRVIQTATPDKGDVGKWFPLFFEYRSSFMTFQSVLPLIGVVTQSVHMQLKARLSTRQTYIRELVIRELFRRTTRLTGPRPTNVDFRNRPARGSG